MGKKIDREAVLSKTLYGVNIYAHILRKFYPGEAVIKVIGRDCGICRNPFADGKKTLHIWYEKIDPTVALSCECAHHHDDNAAIPDGDAFDFAGLYYRQSGQELLEIIDREMNLHIGEERTQYNKNLVPTESAIMFSFFKAPITNTKPLKRISVLDAWNYITGHYARQRTEILRSIKDKKKARIYKAANFDYATFSGEFSKRHNDCYTRESGLLCIDFDHLANLETLFQSLLQDGYFETALLFRSPSGDGLKWIIEIDRGKISHSDYFRAVANYIYSTYGIEVDGSGKDISRACFLPYDPQAFINEKYR